MPSSKYCRVYVENKRLVDEDGKHMSERPEVLQARARPLSSMEICNNPRECDNFDAMTVYV